MDRRISKASRAELIDRFRLEYHKAGKHRKTEILDSIISSTGLNRKYAVWVLGKPKSGAKKTRRKRPSRFRSILPALRRIWEASDHDCSKRLKAVLPLYLALMTRHGSLTPLQDEEIDLLLSISASSIDRLLAPDRQALQLKGISTTRPGSMLKHDIPFRTFADWDDHRPGFFEADLVAFCTEDAHGDYLFSLTMTDIESGWVALGAMLGRSRLACTEILDEAAARIPFPLLGFDSDNDSVFINRHMFDYCSSHGLVFTRSRPNHSNDGCHVEQKNWDVVRRFIGYGRFDTQEQLALFRQALLLIETYQNFFQPSFKLLEKHREGALLHRRFLPPRTPLQSVLESSVITEEVKATLLARLESLDPADLLSRIRAAVAKLRRTL
jgi:hypothetical protein